ncbi:MAG: 3-deoxy-manno-octulosonate cytidylyltransferase [Cryomorphaceae bacterium]|nr:MAG: 3-deoxy-manno-octulosonate cytidylyltransferase [Cryomorphaceae bacterium]
MEFLVVIPARLKSTRLPEKPLVNLCGQSMIERTYRQCLKALPEDQVVVATDHPKIFDHCEERGMRVLMTPEKCLTGTDRVAAVAKEMDASFYVNVQGDEPLFNPEDITRTVEAARNHPGEVINGFAPISDEHSYRSTSVPKVVLRPDGRLLYMSRSPIPGHKQNEFYRAWRQICVYAFPKTALMDFASRNQKTPLESMEDIEILRFLEMGYEVRMIELSQDSIAVDTPEDVERVIAEIKRREQ